MENSVTSIVSWFVSRGAPTISLVDLITSSIGCQPHAHPHHMPPSWVPFQPGPNADLDAVLILPLNYSSCALDFVCPGQNFVEGTGVQPAARLSRMLQYDRGRIRFSLTSDAHQHLPEAVSPLLGSLSLHVMGTVP
jgi:hypothetical protein